MIRWLPIVLLIATLAVPPGIQAQASSNAMDQLSFLTGRWTSDTPDEYQEESWSPLHGQNITGHFRVLHKGTPVFYEFWTVEMDHNTPVLKLKHFNSGLIGWEEKDKSTRMPLRKASANEALFEEEDGNTTLHYQRTGDALTCTVHHVRAGKSEDEIFHLLRQP
jgi:hypothetical protein